MAEQASAYLHAFGSALGVEKNPDDLYLYHVDGLHRDGKSRKMQKVGDYGGAASCSTDPAPSQGFKAEPAAATSELSPRTRRMERRAQHPNSSPCGIRIPFSP